MKWLVHFERHPERYFNKMYVGEKKGPGGWEKNLARPRFSSIDGGPEFVRLLTEPYTIRLGATHPDCLSIRQSLL